MLLIPYVYDALVKASASGEVVSHVQGGLVMAQTTEEARDVVSAYAERKFGQGLWIEISVKDTLLPGYFVDGMAPGIVSGVQEPQVPSSQGYMAATQLGSSQQVVDAKDAQPGAVFGSIPSPATAPDLTNMNLVATVQHQLDDIVAALNTSPTPVEPADSRLAG